MSLRLFFERNVGRIAAVVAAGLLFFFVRGSGAPRAARGPTASASGASPPERAAAPGAGDRAGATVAAVEDAGAASWFVEAGPTIALGGRVFLDGRPVSGAVVVLADTLTSEGAFPTRRASTDAEGRFVFQGVPRIRGGYRLVTAGSERTPGYAWVPGNVSKDDIELRAETCRSFVYGVVSDASGGPIAGARAFLEGVPEQAVVTDPQGKFRLCSPRTTRLRIEADGYGPWQRTLLARGAQRQDITLMPEAGLAGTVVTGDRGEPVPWAIVKITSSGETVREVRADASGRFEVPRIAPGAYAITGRALHASSKAPIEVSVFASSKANVVVRLEPRASVHGRVVSRGGPIAGAAVNIGFAATFEWGTRTSTAEDGSFTVDDVPIGNVLVEVSEYDVETPRTLLVPPGGIAGAEISVAAKGELRVTVTRGGSAVSDATVYVRGLHVNESRATNVSGIATFRGLGEGTYRIFAEDENDFAVKESVAVARGAPATESLDLGVGRQISGRIVDERGDPVDGARISFVPASSTQEGGASATTAADGSFRGGPLRGPVTYRVTVTRSGFTLDVKDEPKSGTLLVVSEAGPPSPPSLVLVVKAQDKELTGTVVDSAGGPVADARVIVSAPDRHSTVLASTFTGNDGTFAFRGLGEGPYGVKAIASSGGVVEVKPVTLPSGSLRLELPRVGSIHGTLSGFSRTPSVMAWSIAGYDWDFHPAVTEGSTFTIPGLSRGRYHVAAATPEAVADATVDVADEGAVELELAAKRGTRTIRGDTRDFVGGGPLPNMKCQAAPYVTDTRSPVVVPGTFFSDDQGAFEMPSAPLADLYMWCTSEGAFRGGVARLPSDLGDRRAVVWGLDMRGKPTLDPDTLGFRLADDHPFSRRVAVIEPKSAAARAAFAVGDVIDSVDDRSVVELGNGVLRAYLALVLAGRKSVTLGVSRGGSTLHLTYRLP